VKIQALLGILGFLGNKSPKATQAINMAKSGHRSVTTAQGGFQLAESILRHINPQIADEAIKSPVWQNIKNQGENAKQSAPQLMQTMLTDLKPAEKMGDIMKFLGS